MIKAIIVIIVLLFGYYTILNQYSHSSTPAPAKYKESELKHTNWLYGEDKDKMTGKINHVAGIHSTNVVHFDFPYEGGTQGRIIIRRSPRLGNNVIFSVYKGQINCNPIDPCNVLMRFDDFQPIKVSARTPESQSSSDIFLVGFNSLLQRFQKSKKLTIEVDFYKDGARNFEFTIADLKI